MEYIKKQIVWPVVIAVIIGTIIFFALSGNLSGENVAVVNENDEQKNVEENGLKEDSNEKNNIEENNEDVNSEQDNSDNKEEKDLSLIPGVTDDKPYGRKLVSDNSKNILVAGMDRISDSYDTIIIISIDSKNKKIKLIQIPRDMYVKYNKKVIYFMKSHGKLDLPGCYKINYAPNIGIDMKYKGKFGSYTSMNFLSDIIEEKFDIKVNDFVRVNPDGFVEIVDLFEGVDIDVPYDMNYEDPAQDLYIHLEEGKQHLDGKQAEGFVRYRKGVDSEGVENNIGDIGRKNNQNEFLKAFFEQKGTIENIDKIPGIVDILSRNVRHSIGVGDVLFSYIGIAKDAVSYTVENEILSGRTEFIEGSSYIIVE
jgi:polyisoprenyl-teichoic acid--peptidoglycan teichoic acid transferase